MEGDVEGTPGTPQDRSNWCRSLFHTTVGSCSQTLNAHKSMTSPKRSGVDGLIKIFAHKEDKEFYSFVNVNLYGQMNNFMHMR